MTSLDEYAPISSPEALAGIGWNLDPWVKHLSPSSIAMLHRCPRQWQERYIHKRKKRPAEAPFLGSTFHKAIEKNFKQKIDSGVDLPIIDLLDYYAEEAFPDVLREEQEEAGEEIFWDTEPTKTQSAEDIVRARGKVMVTEYQDQIAPRIQPLASEFWIEADFGLPVPLIGKFDVEREATVIDAKTSKQTNRKPKEDWRIQAAIYSRARQKPVEFHNVSWSKTGKITIVSPLDEEALLVHPTRQEREQIARSIKTLADLACWYMEQYGPDEPWPTLGRFHGWACDYCGFRSDCPAWTDL
jgi:hypothetical protein